MTAATATNTATPSSRKDTVTTISSFSADDQARGWMEVSLLLLQDTNGNNDANGQPQPTTAAASLGERLLLGHSVVLLAPDHNFVTDMERHLLITNSLATADATEPTDFETTGRRRLPTVDAANRAASTGTECGTPLDETTDAVVQTCYQRIAAYLDQTWPDAVQIWFGSNNNNNEDNDNNVVTSLTTLMHSGDQLQYASREPAINIYRAGGAFAAHQDDETLTALICLSDPEQDFTGGGTAFWAPKFTSSSEPVVVIRPPARTVMLFGGTVTHAACPVTDGCRVMVVSSFGRKEEQDEPTFLLY